MNTKRKRLMNWIKMFGVPAMIVALLLVGLIGTGYEFLVAGSLEPAIEKDLQKSEQVASPPSAPAEESPTNAQ